MQVHDHGQVLFGIQRALDVEIETVFTANRLIKGVLQGQILANPIGPRAVHAAQLHASRAVVGGLQRGVPRIRRQGCLPAQCPQWWLGVGYAQPLYGALIQIQ